MIEQIQVWTRSPGVCVTVRSDRNTDKLQHKVQALAQVSQSPERQGWAGLRAAPSRCGGSIRAWVRPHVLRGLLHLATTALRTSKGRRDGKGSDGHEWGPASQPVTGDGTRGCSELNLGLPWVRAHPVLKVGGGRRASQRKGWSTETGRGEKTHAL